MANFNTKWGLAINHMGGGGVGVTEKEKKKN